MLGNMNSLAIEYSFYYTPLKRDYCTPDFGWYQAKACKDARSIFLGPILVLVTGFCLFKARADGKLGSKIGCGGESQSSCPHASHWETPRESTYRTVLAHYCKSFQMDLELLKSSRGTRANLKLLKVGKRFWATLLCSVKCVIQIYQWSTMQWNVLWTGLFKTLIRSVPAAVFSKIRDFRASRNIVKATFHVKHWFLANDGTRVNNETWRL